MANRRQCPECKTTLPPGSGVRFDAQHNVICSHCGGVVFPAHPSKEKPDKKPINNGGYPHYDTDTATFSYPQQQIGWQGRGKMIEPYESYD